MEHLTERGAFLGISIANPAISAPSLEALLDWADGRFRVLNILVGDYIERHNYLWEKSDDPPGAIALAMAKAAPVQTTIADVLRRRPGSAIKVIDSRDLILDSRFGAIYAQAASHFEQTPEFRETVLDDIERYISRRRKHGQSRLPYERLIRHSVDYVLEEIAMFSMLVESGLSVQLYPGRHLRVLTDLASGQLPSPVPGLNNLVCVDLSVT
ncbi:MAG: tRNA-dependent cyclodipeptide synthase [Opitutaceae bacterium]|nr:tRNA-dependent cyclodipeptide synthase [Opitutaceae bacterium]